MSNILPKSTHIDQTHHQIDRGRRRLLALILLGLALPLGMGIYMSYLSVDELIKDNRFLNLADVFFAFAMGFFVIFGIGIWIGKGMYNGKKWAFNSWGILGIISGTVLFVIGLSETGNDMTDLLVYMVPGMVVILIGLLATFQKSIQLYRASLPAEKTDKLIAEIGKADSHTQ